MKTIVTVLFCIALAGCAADSNLLQTPEADRYRCENDVGFTVKFANDSAVVNSNRGYEVLYRTAGGLTPSQTVYSNPRMQAEFGLGATGREAILRYLLQPVALRCVRE
jgi:hypothetical protein